MSKGVVCNKVVKAPEGHDLELGVFNVMVKLIDLADCIVVVETSAADDLGWGSAPILSEFVRQCK